MKQESPLPVSVELARGATADSALADGEGALGDASSEPAADVRGYVDYARSQAG